MEVSRPSASQGLLRQRNVLGASAVVLLASNLVLAVLFFGSNGSPNLAVTPSDTRPSLPVTKTTTISSSPLSLFSPRRSMQATTPLVEVCPVSLNPCMGADPTARTAACFPSDPNVFEELSEAEYNEARWFVGNRSAIFNTTTSPGIIDIETYFPPKADVLEYLAGLAPKPTRAAKVHVIVNRDGQLKRVAIRVYPLPQATNYQMVPVLKQQMETPWRVTGVTGAHNQNATWIVGNATMRLMPIISTIYDGAGFGPNCTSKCVAVRSPGPSHIFPTPEGGWKVYNNYAYTRMLTNSSVNFDGSYLHRLYFLEFMVDMLPTPSLFKIWFMGEYFDTVQELLNAWNEEPTNPTAARAMWREVKVPMPVSAIDPEAIYSTFQKRAGPVRGEPGRPLGPIQYDPYGKRFTISRNKVSWMGWELEAGTGKKGPRYWNILFKGERIAYELSVQEALAAYGAIDPGMAHIVYYDGQAYSMGYLTQQLTHGLDCPLNSAYIDLLNGGRLRRRAMCVFEHDTSLPILAHHPQASSGGGHVRGTALILRVRTTVGNYDYYHQITLHLDGSLQTDVILTGYMSGASYMPGASEAYSSPIASYMSGSLHDHPIGWKVDLDVGGLDNSVEVSEVVADVYTNYAGYRWATKKLVKHIVDVEENATFTFNPMTPKTVRIVNLAETNKWGAPRAYQIHVNKLHYNVLPDDFAELKAAAWTKHNLVVTRRKEGEATTSLDNDYLFMWDPVLDFDTYIDGESVNGTDLVAWVMSGTYHVPHSEDAPVTPTTSGNSAGFILQPFNYFDENAAMDAPDLFTAKSTDTIESMVPLIQQYAEQEKRCQPAYEKLRLMRE